MALVDSTHPMLNEILQKVSLPSGHIQSVVDDMKKIMIEENGLGLAANQVGLNLRLFIIGDPSSEQSIFPVINPTILEYSPNKILMEEGCLTYPDMRIKIRRPSWIKARFQNLDGSFRTEQYAGVTARCFQHEYDHLNGIKFFARASRFHVEQARRHWKRDNRRKKRNERNKHT